jgi:RimJ/RimL family protein N-acetyltransferase
MGGTVSHPGTSCPSTAHTIRTERLRLCPLRSGDAVELIAIFSDPEVMHYGSTPPWSSMAHATAVIEQDVKAEASGRGIQFAIEHSDDARLLGKCSLFNLHAPSQRAEIGYALVRHD